MRLAVLSSRDVDPATYWRNLAFPLEDALAAHPDATLIVAPPFRRPSFRASRPAWLESIRAVRKADVVFWAQLHLQPPRPVWALAYTRPRARRAVMAVDSWPSIHARLIVYVKAQGLSHCFLPFRQSVLALKAAAPNRHFEWLPFGFNARVFRDRGVERDIFVSWVGRRYEPFHEALRTYCSRKGLKYEYLEPPGRPIPLDELSSLAARSRYFVAFPPDLGDPLRTGGFSPLTLRYLEGVGSGCRLLGARPASGEFDLMLPPDALVECAPDGSDLDEVLGSADDDPSFAARAAAASVYAHSEHTWERRAEAIHGRLRGEPEQDLFQVGRRAETPAAAGRTTPA